MHLFHYLGWNIPAGNNRNVIFWHKVRKDTCILSDTSLTCRWQEIRILFKYASYYLHKKDLNWNLVLPCRSVSQNNISNNRNNGV